MRRAVKVGDGDPGECGIEDENAGVGEVFRQHDLPEGDRRCVKKLHAHGVSAEAVEDEVGEHENRVGGGAGERHVGRAVEAAGLAHGIHRSHAEDDQHEDGHDQSEQHGAAAGEVADLLFEYGGDGLRDPGQVPSHLQALNLLHLGACSGFAEILAAELGAQTQVQQESDASGQHCKYEQRQDAELEVCVADLGDGARRRVREAAVPEPAP